MDQESHVFPFDLESPIPIMFWDPLEFTLSLILMGFGIIAHMWILGVLMGGGVLIGARYLKRGSKRGAMQHFLWAHGLQLDAPLKTRFKPAWLNDFTE
ncbi:MULTISPECIES: type IV conjugative transfer system protein TraL [unclassified Variovorax]|uniref:type IV conjugative transfer system protein TraL n=1 Tax=unclassified Variovorax TaxID=663243 RepID=UPI000837CF08|nr:MULTISPECIES: type IV conjugative transfer system protein TraL [unclassified Variovorax]PNG50017.1 hypothetical protein CHC06_05598 [Variovorax sp. B2]PNG50889.1 hypothetical protein CHC07_05503 [Variovorax sp. B4]VTU41480.1 TraL protein [Variovorax sp. SRS16]VTU41511.1 TraL protein [Variovorax sp. PBL-E5]VTU44832.1 TraL protein [Variovorax sp. PBL-H6]